MSQDEPPQPRLVVYGQTPEQSLEMEVVTPTTRRATTAPGVLFVHGGGWSGGNRGQFRRHAQELARRGFVAATASYRLSGVAGYPAALDDCQRAMRWLRKNADELGMDPNRLGAMGSSAGGHLVACLGTRETRDDSDPALAGISSKAQCVVDVHGAHDLPWSRSLQNRPLANSLLAFLRADYDQARALWEDASPIRFVDSTTAPTLVIHDPGDPTVPYEDSVRFTDALVRAARPVEFMPVPGAGHGFVYHFEGEWAQRVWPVAVAWLERWLKP